MSTANARQVAGDHYKTDNAAGLQHWDLVDDYGVGYLAGCASKYLTRFRRKNGAQDLQKAHHYLEKMIENYGLIHRHEGDIPALTLAIFFADNGLSGAECEPLRLIFNWLTVADLKIARTWVESLIAEYDGSAPGAGYVNQR